VAFLFAKTVDSGQKRSEEVKKSESVKKNRFWQEKVGIWHKKYHFLLFFGCFSGHFWTPIFL
jgi:hypothetical protein